MIKYPTNKISQEDTSIERLSVYLVVGEPSGDVLASRLMKAIRKKKPETDFCGTGGETMKAEGFDSLFNIKDLSVMGFTEIIPKLPVILRLRKEILQDIEKVRPDVIVTVDSWGFVNSVLKQLKKKKCKIPKIHYVAPQVWAWKKGRAKKAAKIIEHLMTLLPYESSYFEKYGLDCTFTGHPVIENIMYNDFDLAKSKFAEQNQGKQQMTSTSLNHRSINETEWNIPQNARVLCVLCGSRHSEVSRLAPVFVETVKILNKKIKNLFLLIPSVETVKDEINRYFKNIEIPYKMITGQQNRYKAFRASEFAIAASGTVSLELAACGTPHIVAYKFNLLTNAIVELLSVTKYANLINILADRFIIPEFVLRNCRAGLIAPEVISFFKNKENGENQIAQANEHLAKLKPATDQLPSEKAAETVLNLIDKHKIKTVRNNTLYRLQKKKCK